MNSSWLRYLRTNKQAKMKLFCFPYAGSGPGVFNPWLQSFDSEIEVVSIHYPGREARISEPPFTDLDKLVETLYLHIAPHLDKPFAFFGHSMGAYVAFILSMYLANKGVTRPEHLFVSGAGAPFLVLDDPIHELDSKQFLKAVIRLNGIPKECLKEPELIACCLPALRADFTACERYRFDLHGELDLPVTLLGGTRDPRVSLSHLDAWSTIASRGMDKHLFEGDHFFINQYKAKIAKLINQTLLG